MDPKHLVTHYKAKQAKPVFTAEDPAPHEESEWGPRFALLAFIVFAASFAAFFVYLAFINP